MATPSVVHGVILSSSEFSFNFLALAASGSYAGIFVDENEQFKFFPLMRSGMWDASVP